jgi:hypothetical protein
MRIQKKPQFVPIEAFEPSKNPELDNKTHSLSLLSDTHGSGDFFFFHPHR